MTPSDGIKLNFMNEHLDIYGHLHYSFSSHTFSMPPKIINKWRNENKYERITCKGAHKNLMILVYYHLFSSFFSFFHFPFLSTVCFSNRKIVFLCYNLVTMLDMYYFLFGKIQRCPDLQMILQHDVLKIVFIFISKMLNQSHLNKHASIMALVVVFFRGDRIKNNNQIKFIEFINSNLK